MTCLWRAPWLHLSLFFFNAPPPTEISTLSLHDALPISLEGASRLPQLGGVPTADLQAKLRSSASTPPGRGVPYMAMLDGQDRKSTRLNSSHSQISYAVFCLKKKTAVAHPSGAGEV